MASKARAPRHLRATGTPRVSPIVRLVRALFVLAALALLAAPLAGMPFVRETDDAEKRELAEVPQLVGEQGPNLQFLSDAGAYFEDHFAGRSVLVDLDATLRQRLFLTSATDNVVVGADGWLYYAGELGDYQRSNAMSDEALRNAATNLALVQEHFAAQGKGFALVVAPNKSTVAPQRMPYYLLAGEGESNLERLLPLLAERGVNVVDVSEALGKTGNGSQRYFARDSHWNDTGALVAYDALMRALGHEPVDFLGAGTTASEHLGDLDAMLHPTSAEPEAQDRPATVDQYELMGDATGVEDAYLATTSTRPGATGTLLVYRDSFGNNLIPSLASTYAQAVFTKRIPYNMGDDQASFAQDVIVERAERHLSFFSTNPPYLSAPARSLGAEGEPTRTSTTVFAEQLDTFLLVDGTLDEASAHEEHVYVELRAADGATRTFECFRESEPAATSADFEGQALPASGHVQGDAGYRAYVYANELGTFEPIRARILVGNSGEAHEVARLDL